MSLLDEIAALTAQPAERGERGMVDGRRTSTPVSRQAPADLDKIDADLHARAIMRKWAAQIIEVRGYSRTFHWAEPVKMIQHHWQWAVAQPWGPAMVAELEQVRENLANGGRSIPVVPCPVCNELVRIDEIVTEHRACIETAPLAE
jgi:hypothetical protein